MSRRPFRLLLASLILGALAAAAFGASGGIASRTDDVGALAAQLAQCKKDLAQARDAIATAEELQAQIAKKKVVLILSEGQLVPVDVQAATRFFILEFVSGEIPKSQLIRELQRLAHVAAVSARLAGKLASESRADRDEIEERCAGLASKLKAAQTGGQSTTITGQAGAFPGGTATKLTLTFQGSTVVTELKTNAQSPDHQAATVHLQSGDSFGGTVSLNGTLPPGWTVVVFHPTPATIQLNSHTGGEFQGITQPKGFGASTTLAAYICKQLPVQTGNCSAQADIDIGWKP